MSSLWRRRGGRGAEKRDCAKGINTGTELTVPSHFRCPISLDLMRDPVSLATGITYDRESIDKWIDMGHATCPVTNQLLRNHDQIPNHALRKMIQEWCVDNKSYGVERIPTPRVPLTRYEVSEVCSRMAAATSCHDDMRCRELVTKVKNMAKESDRNRRCLVSNGIEATLADMFEEFARFSVEKQGNLLKEILSALVWSFPLGGKGVSKLKSTVSLRCMAQFLKGEDLSSRRSAILVLKELVLSRHDRDCDHDHDQGCVNGLMRIEGIEEALFQVVKVPICPRATQACLVVIHHMMLAHEKITERFVEIGLVDLVLDILVDGNKSTCEKALGVLDDVCSSEEGKQRAYKNALTIPILVKKILRVSDLGTEFCVSSLWKVCGGGGGNDEDGVVEVLKVGGFQKLLVVLQVGCGERTKEKVTDLLKFMNVCRNKVECFDSSMGFKYVKRPI